MGCENLATKADLNSLNSKLEDILRAFDNLATKEDISRIETKLNSIDNKLDELLDHQSKTKGTVDNVWGFLSDLVDSIISPIRVLIREFSEGVQTLINGVKEIILQGLRSLENIIVQGLRSTENVINNTVSEGVNLINNSVNGLVRVTESGFSVVNNAIDSVENVIVTSLREGFGSINNAIDSVENILNNIIDSIENIAVTIINGVRDIVVSSVDLLKVFISEVFETVRNTINNMTSVLNTVIENIDKIFYLIAPLLEAINAARIIIIESIRALIQELIEAMQFEFRAEDGLANKINEILSACSGINGKLGNFPNGCDLSTSFGSVSDGLRMMICGYAIEGGGNTLNQQELANILSQILNELNQINNGGDNEENAPESLRGRIEEIYLRLGCADYPVNVPVNLTGNNLATTQIQNITQFQSWQTKQFYNMLGHYPVSITIKDTDLIKTGNQEVTLEYKNISQSLADLIGLNIVSNSKNDALMTIGLKNLIETGSTRKQAIVSYRLLEAIQSYLGFKTKHKTERVKFSFDPLVGSNGGSESLTKALTNSEQTIKIEVEDEDKSLEQKLMTLIEAARIIKGRFFEKLDPNSVDDFVQNIKDLSSNIDDSGNNEDFSTFLERVERGFTDSEGITDNQNPYGRPYDQRPRIRELGNLADETE